MRAFYNMEHIVLPSRTFLPTHSDIAKLSELADLEKLSVMSYNLLSQMGARRIQRKDMNYVDSAFLNTMRRREILLAEILNYEADILCLQEVDDYEDYWAIHLTSNGYDSVFASHPSQTHDHGLLIAFRKDTFQLFRTEKIDLNAITTSITDENLAAKAKQDNLALMVNLQPWENSLLPSAICVVTTQLVATPSLEKIRVLQVEYLCRTIAQHNASFHLPIVLTGSFNALPSSDVYHVIHTGRRRPTPQMPETPDRPVPQDPTPSSVRLTWIRPCCGDAPILGYRIGVKNCTSMALGFSLHEQEINGDVSEAVVMMLSAGIPYQFRIAARNEYGYGSFSQPSHPITTPQTYLESIQSEAKFACNDVPLYIIDDIPPQVKPYDPSFGSGRTPRFESGDKNMEVSPRKLLQSHLSSDMKQHATLHSRGDRDEFLVHGEQFESAYGTYQGYISEPEFTYSSEKFIGTVDYIFYSSMQFAPFQWLSLPTLDELEEIGVDIRQQDSKPDTEWARHKPKDWNDTLTNGKNDEKYMGEWVVPDLPNTLEQSSPWLPNRVYPSDHIVMVCVLAVRKEHLAVEWN